MPIEDADINKQTNRFATQTTYDEAGNVIVDSKFRTSSFNYDANGRMVKATRANVPDAMSVYDASGMRVAEKVNDVWRFLIYDIGGKLIAEYGGLQPTDEGGVKYLCSDWQGSTRAIVSNTGYVQARMDYTSFGEDIQAGTGIRTTAQGFNSNNNLRQRYGLTERDEATGLDHTWFRKNENKAGRWTSPDPYNGSMNLGNPQSFNRYSYVENQPTNYVDPSGLNAVSFFCYDIVTTGHYTNDPSHVYTNTRTVCSSFGGGGSSGNSTTGGIEIGGGSGGGGGDVIEVSYNDDAWEEGIKCLSDARSKYFNTAVDALKKYFDEYIWKQGKELAAVAIAIASKSPFTMVAALSNWLWEHGIEGSHTVGLYKYSRDVLEAFAKLKKESDLCKVIYKNSQRRKTLFA